MKRFAIGLTIFLLILGVTACLALLGYEHLKTRSASPEVPASGSVEQPVSVASLPDSDSASASESSQEPESSSLPEPSSSEPESSSEPALSEPQEPPEELITLEEDDEWRLRLVNQTHLLPEDYDFEKGTIEGSFTFDARAAQALIQMLADGRAAGYSLRVVSTFRTVERSEYLYTNKIQIEYGKVDTNK